MSGATKNRDYVWQFSRYVQPYIACGCAVELGFPSVLQPLANFGTARATGACIFAFDDYIAAVDAWIPPSLFV